VATVVGGQVERTGGECRRDDRSVFGFDVRSDLVNELGGSKETLAGSRLATVSIGLLD